MVIDHREVEFRPEETILEAALRHGIKIPTLCYHAGIEKYGGCRLCLVELQEQGRGRIVAACTFPAAGNLNVLTHTPQVKELRQGIINLLFEQVGPLPQLIEIARQNGLEVPSEVSIRKEKCLLCGRCVRVCSALGVKAINFVGRGKGRKIEPPFNKESSECLVCLACFHICPTEAIVVSEDERSGKVALDKWKTESRLLGCPSCGKFFAPERQLNHLREKLSGMILPSIDLCPNCRQRQNVAAFSLEKRKQN